MALTEGRAAGVLGELGESPRSSRGGDDLDLQPHRALPVRRRRGRRRVAGARRPRPRGRDPPDRAGRPPLLAARRRRRRAPLPGHRRARLDDHRRGRDPGPGQARLRAGAGRGRDRPDPQPPLPRGAGRRQARPHRRPGSPSAASRCRRWRSSWRSARSATSSSRRVLVVGAGETAELTARALAARGVEAVFIANRRYDRAIGLAQRFGGRAVRFEELPAQMERGRHRRRLDQLAPPRDRARGARPR